ncbi:MAG TPA: FAD-dependent oxidoreductase [Stellaceae bacterium]|jgi:glycine/D-amino acid oxidase-like deaminating enzyme|nr:FAD-dependent oxidoreductase [Stellaceae bacterium]
MAKIVIIGGGVIGSSIAYHLAIAGHAADVVVIEPDPTYEFAASPRATGGIRQLFTVPENIRMAQYGHEIYRQFETLMAVDGEPTPINFQRMGYLWLGSGKADVDALMANWRVQTAHDARVELLDRKGVKHRFPSMWVDDIDIAAYSPDDGFMDPYSVLMGFRRKAVSLGIKYLKDRVVDFEVGDKHIAAVKLESGERLAGEFFVNAANCWGPELCDKLGMKVPVYPMHRLTFYFEIREKLEMMPLTRHISKNVSFRPQGAGYITGNTKYDVPPGFNWEVDYDYFDEAIWPGLAERVPAFEALKVSGAWAGHYDQNSFDNNAILGPCVGGLDNFHIALGFSGHGLMQAPAVGRGMSELLLHGRYQTLDLSRMGYRRILDGKPLLDQVPKA